MLYGASISPDGRFRNHLWRVWSEDGQHLIVIMLNPSTADASVNDPTILWLIAFAQLHGYGGLEVFNLYDFRTPSPKELKQRRYPCSALNTSEGLADAVCVVRSALGGDVVCAWGANAQPNRAMDLRVDFLMRKVPLKRFDAPLTKNGQPRHPLYLKRSVQLVELESPFA